MKTIQRQAETKARLDVIAAEMGECSRSQAAKWIEQGLCRVNEIVRSKPGYGVAPGDNVELTVPDPVELTVEKEDIPLEILYEDEDVAVVNKPCGMVVHPAPGNETGTLVNALLYAMDDLSGIGGVSCAIWSNTAVLLKSVLSTAWI